MAPTSVTSPADLAVVVPYLLGFHPRRSLVLVAVRGNQLGLLQRIDLPERDEVSEVDLERMARQLVARACRDGASHIIAIAYESSPQESRRTVRAVVRSASRSVRAVTSGVVRDGRWYPDGGGKANRVGYPLPDPERVPAVAELILEGMAALPDRSDIADHVIPGRGPRVDEVVSLLAEPPAQTGPATPARWAEVWRRVLAPRGLSSRGVGAGLHGPGADITVDDLVEVIRSLEDTMWRDALIAVLCPTSGTAALLAELPLEAAGAAACACAWITGRAEGPASADDGEVLDLPSALSVLVAVLGETPAERSAPLLTVIAHLAWWSGSGALAACALDEARRHDPEYRLAVLLQGLVDHGVRLPAA